MKTMIKLTMLVLALNVGQAFAQKSNDVSTVMYECNFDCPSCKDKVMKNIAYEKGVKSVTVIYEEKLVTVSFKASKNTAQGIQEALVDLGYETQNLGVATSFVVKGNCGMCEDKIEKAALGIDGVNAASWNVESKELTLAFDHKKTSLDNIHQAIATIGYDTDKVRANDEVYDNLHHCCKYER